MRGIIAAAGLLAETGVAAVAGQGTGVAPSAGTNQFNFRGASLEQALDYLSEAAGFIINKQTEVRGSVEIWSKEPLTRDEAVQLLNSVLKKNGYAALRSGRMLTIISAEDAKSSDLEVVHGGDPESAETSDEVITQVIPVRFANANQLIKNLQPLLPVMATLTVNESANSLVLVATRTQVKRTLRIVSALDNSMARASSIKVIPMQHADAMQLAAAIQQLFPVQPRSGNANTSSGPEPQMFNFPGGPPEQPRFPTFTGDPGQPTGSSTSSSAGTPAGSRVVAVADETSNSLIISASADILAGIADMVTQIDQPVAALTEVRAFRLKNADPTELAEQLGELFPDSTRNSGQGGSTPVFGDSGLPIPSGRFGGYDGPPGASGFPGYYSTQGGSSTRVLKAGQVIAVADPRTSSLLVSAGSVLMPQIAALVERLDTGVAGREAVMVFDLNNADPTQVRQVLEDLFNRNLEARNGAQSGLQDSDTDPLLSRQTQQPTGAYEGNAGFGASRGVGGSGSGLGSSTAP